MSGYNNSRSRSFRIFDVVCALGGLFILVPVFVLAALAIILDDGGPVFFRQVRIGLDGAPFRIWKFRTMTAGAAGTAVTAADDHRITRVGAVLRRWKIDELPQLLNVIAGEMSLVGPRPEVPRYVDIHAAVWRAILSVRPGITDLATLMYRDEEQTLSKAVDTDAIYREIILPDKLQLSFRYLQLRSFRRDLKLLLMTIASSISGRACRSAACLLIENRSV